MKNNFKGRDIYCLNESTELVIFDRNLLNTSDKDKANMAIYYNASGIVKYWIKRPRIPVCHTSHSCPCYTTIIKIIGHM